MNYVDHVIDQNNVYHAIVDMNAWKAQTVLGAKNFADVTASTSTAGNITFMVNGDKTVSITGSANTSTTIKDLNTYTGAQLKAIGNTLIISGGNALAYLAIRASDWSKIIRSYGEDVAFNTSELSDAATYYLTIGIQANVNANGVVIKPMIRLASDPDATYAPYAMTNKELTESILSALFSNPVKLTSSNDLNNLKTPGIYYVSNSVPTNAPTGMSNTYACFTL